MTLLFRATVSLVALSSAAVAFSPSLLTSNKRMGAASKQFTPFGIIPEVRGNTSVKMIGGFIQGIFGKKTADITDTCFFDISIDGKPAGRIELGLYGRIQESYRFVWELCQILFCSKPIYIFFHCHP
jgi:hypothetical protein